MNKDLIPSVHGARCQMVPVVEEVADNTLEHDKHVEFYGDEELLELKQGFERA